MKPHKTLEAEIFRSYWDDGLLDILCGLGLLAVGIGWHHHLVVVAATVPVLLSALWLPLRLKWVAPRAGFVKFSRSRERRTTRGLWLTFTLGVVTLIALVAAFIWFQGRTLPGLEKTIAGLPAALLAPGAFLVGLLTGARRFYAYGLALAAAGGLTVALAAGPALPFLAVGALVSGVGVLLFAHFITSSSQYQREAAP